MSDEKPESPGATGKIKAWFKALVGALAGLLSGALAMYLSPLLDKVVKPAKPVANFAVESKGLTATISNQSSNGSEGWLDFGDGSPLEPISPKQMTITHTYARPDSYYAKLTWRNLFGDENDRTVKVELESPHADPPAIVSLEATPISPGAYAPATFRVVSKTTNAKLCVWDWGDDRNLEFSMETPDNQDRLVTFKKPGGYMVKVAAVNGDRGVEKSTIVYVDEPPPGTVAAIVSVTDQGTRVEKLETPIPIAANFPPHQKEDTYRFDRQVPAKQGFEITAARLETVSDKGVRNLELKTAPDRQSVHLTGELVKEGGGGLFQRNAAPPSLMVRVILTQERRVSETRPAVPITGTIGVPGSLLLSLPPLPANWIDSQRQLRLELRDGDRVVWQESQLPRGTPVTLRNHRCTLTATPLNWQVRVDLIETKPSPGPATD